MGVRVVFLFELVVVGLDSLLGVAAGRAEAHDIHLAGDKHEARLILRLIQDVLFRPVKTGAVIFAGAAGQIHVGIATHEGDDSGELIRKTGGSDDGAFAAAGVAADAGAAGVDVKLPHEIVSRVQSQADAVKNATIVGGIDQFANDIAAVGERGAPGRRQAGLRPGAYPDKQTPFTVLGIVAWNGDLELLAAQVVVGYPEGCRRDFAAELLVIICACGVPFVEHASMPGADRRKGVAFGKSDQALFFANGRAPVDLAPQGEKAGSRRLCGSTGDGGGACVDCIDRGPGIGGRRSGRPPRPPRPKPPRSPILI